MYLRYRDFKSINLKKKKVKKKITKRVEQDLFAIRTVSENTRSGESCVLFADGAISLRISGDRLRRGMRGKQCKRAVHLRRPAKRRARVFSGVQVGRAPG